MEEKIVPEYIIKAIENKYNDEYKAKIALDKAEGLISSYFSELKYTLKNYFKNLNHKIKLEINTDKYIAYLQIEDEYIYFKRENECISVFMKIENKEHHYKDIIPNSEWDGCEIGGYKFWQGEINRCLKKAFNFIPQHNT
ncbi:hypothetical protein [Clostridium sp. UBA7791]|uniref:hypothetical protein n=1 Tax=Clostridium sp. UBA7791 TaxID=1946379 RepID=UPI003216C481